MLLHCVHCAIPASADRAELAAVMAELDALRAEVPGMLWLRHGANRDYEGRSAGYPYGFVIAFEDRAAHLAYDRHARHRAAGARLVALCEGGVAGLMVHDIEAD